MTCYNFGDILLVKYPFTDLSTAKKRPAVVVSSEIYHRHRSDVLLMAITSQVGKQGIFETPVVSWQAAGLLKPSVIKPVMATIEFTIVEKHLGVLLQEDVNNLIGLLRQVFDFERLAGEEKEDFGE